MAADTYFRPVAIEVFGERLRALGARLVGNDPWIVRYESDRWFVELVALPDDGPKYSPRVEIGPLPERGILTRNTQFDILYTLPTDSPLRRYNLEWRYTNEVEMRASYVRVLNEIFEPYVAKLLSDINVLDGLLDFRSKQVGKEWHNEIRDHNEAVYRAKAKEALGAKDYHTYVSYMRKVPSERQSPSERARVKYVEKRFLRTPV